MSEWITAPLGDFITFQRGIDITRRSQTEGTVPVVSSGGVSSYHGTAFRDGPGVVIGRKGTLGKTFYLPGPYWPHDTTLWVRDFKKSYPRFVYYFMSRFDISWLDTGSANPTLNRNHLHPIVVTWPAPAEQQAIAEVLGALDDKIAANTRLAATADELADTAFRKYLDSATRGGTRFEEVADIGGGGTPSTKNSSYWGGELNWATPTDVTALDAPYLACTARSITHDGLAACSSPLYPVGTILMTSRATIGAFAVLQVESAVNQGFITVRPTDRTSKWWLFHEMRSRVDEFKSWANGATFPELSRGKFKKLPVRLAARRMMQEFDAYVDSFHARAAAAIAENRTLAATRDALLPHLMSGKIRVREIEDAAEEGGL
ncbi:hypothetical protein GCM10010915_06220 [Microbacterium faecale]|uniref:Type I restriction modification DNA specificity domain-containing protein n=1 Tax=Microbacterium faecale TaxID=1804630 RepID=A0A916Y2W7_9MICO|nr:restriction endonuclease subunit S [Microbacterium faecale]GGD28883.1 hypothetical protein GCM10010915_06220 [Microbacterium faecale]